MKFIDDNNFAALVTTDCNLQLQQNLSKFSLVTVMLTLVIKKYQNLLPLIKPLLSILEKPPVDKGYHLKKE